MKEILQKKSRDISGYENLDSPAQVQFQLSNFNRCKLQSKLSYYEIHSGATYLEVRTDGIVNESKSDTKCSNN